jgi:hypothetical protein
MAWENSQARITLTAAADLSALQYRFVKVDGDGKAAICGDDGNAIGVLQNAPGSGEAATIAISGVTKLYIGTTSTLDSGSIISCEADGAGKIQDSGAYRLGICLEDSTANGDIISIVFTGANGSTV